MSSWYTVDSLCGNFDGRLRLSSDAATDARAPHRAAACGPGIQNAACPVDIVIFDHFRPINIVIRIDNNDISSSAPSNNKIILSQSRKTLLLWNHRRGTFCSTSGDRSGPAVFSTGRRRRSETASIMGHWLFRRLSERSACQTRPIRLHENRYILFRRTTTTTVCPHIMLFLCDPCTRA